MTEAITVVKNDAAGHIILHYDGEVLARGTNWVCLRAVFSVVRAAAGPLEMRQGDVFVEWFYTDRWYNVFRVQDGATGALKGWYCNVTRPAAITRNQVVADDLALDVVIMPDGTQHVLDQTEFEALALPPEEYLPALGAITQLQYDAFVSAPPFDTPTTWP